MMPVLQLGACLAVFLGLVFGLGLPLVAGLPLRADERVALAPGVALIVLYLAAFAVYAFRLPAACFLLLPAAAGAGLVWRWRPLLAALRDPPARSLLGAYAIWTGWALGFLALVRCYFGVGAGATGDWLEHYQRTGFFLGHWPLDYRFIWLYPLPARPPLANLVTGVLLALTSETFPYFQVFSTLESTLVLLPAWLLCRRFNAGRAPTGVLLLLCMLNPLLLHNATYPWTKLITAYFVLAGLHLFLEGRERGSTARASAAFLFLSAGLLAHYSAGPYLLVLALLSLWAHRRRWFSGAFAAGLAAVAAPSVLLLATWFGWSWRHYGFAATTASNTAVTTMDVSSAGGFAAAKLGDLVTTLLPLPWRDPSHPAAPPSWDWPAVLDQHFYLFYQLTVPAAFGWAGAVVLLFLLGRGGLAILRGRGPPEGRFWTIFVSATLVIGIWVNGRYDIYGLANICLQPLVVLGLAYLGARLPGLSRVLRIACLAGAAVDGALGIALHFWVEHLAPAILASAVPAAGAAGLAPWWTDNLVSNLLAKYYFGFQFAGDPGPPLWLVTAWLAACLLVAVWRCGRAVDVAGPPAPLSPGSAVR